MPPQRRGLRTCVWMGRLVPSRLARRRRDRTLGVSDSSLAGDRVCEGSPLSREWVVQSTVAGCWLGDPM